MKTLKVPTKEINRTLMN